MKTSILVSALLLSGAFVIGSTSALAESDTHDNHSHSQNGKKHGDYSHSEKDHDNQATGQQDTSDDMDKRGIRDATPEGINVDKDDTPKRQDCDSNKERDCDASQQQDHTHLGHLQEAIKHSEAAVQADDVKTIAEHAKEAKKHATAAKAANPQDKLIQEGLENLDEAIKESLVDEAASARKAVIAAHDKFSQAAEKAGQQNSAPAPNTPSEN